MLGEALETGRKELYFKRIALHLEGAINHNLHINAIGQDSLSLSCKMIDIICKRFEDIDDTEFKRIGALDVRNSSVMESVELEKDSLSVEKAMKLLKIHKDMFVESDWEYLVEYKGRIVQLHEDRA